MNKNKPYDTWELTDRSMLLSLTTVEFPALVKVDKPIDPTKYIFLVEVIAHKFRKKFGGKFERIEDTEPYSIASLELVKAAASYNPRINEDFSRYAFRAMRNGIIESIRYRNRKKRTAEFYKLTNVEWQEIPAEDESIPSNVMNADLNQVLLDIEDSEQDRIDKAILAEIYLHGKKIPLVAEKYGITRMTVYNRIHRIIGKIRQRHPDFIEDLDECPKR